MVFQQGMWVLAWLIMLSSACTTVTPVSVFNKFDELEMSRNFSSQTIQKKPFVVNVIGLDRLAPSDAAIPSSKEAGLLLAHQFQSYRSDLLINTPELQAKEEKTLAGILKQFEVKQEFPVEGYTFLQKQPWHDSWFLIADLERADAQQDLTEDDIKDSQGKFVDKKYSYTSSRILDVRYFIYDADARQLVFMGLIRSTTQATHDQIGSGRDTNYPDIPSIQKSLNQNFQRFVRSLPSTRGI